MADNVTLNAGSLGVDAATDDITGVHYQIIKLAHGALDSATLVSTSSGLPVQMQGTWNITNAGTFAVQVDGAALTALQVIDNPVLVDDAAFTPATSSVMMAGFQFDDVAPDSVNEGDAGAARMSANRSIYVNIRDNAGNERGLNVDANGAIAVTDGSGSLTVDGTVTANLAAGTNNIGDVDVLTVPAPLNLTGGGVEASALRVTIASDSTGVLSIDDNGGSITVDGTVGISGTVTVGSHAVTNAGTFAVQVDGSALTALQLIDDVVYADDAAFTLTSSKVAAVGGVRDDSLTTLSAVEGDVVPLRVDATGALHVTGGGGGTQYTEDVAAAADPVGNAQILVRADTPATVTSTDGDNIAQRGTNYGAAYVQLVTSAGAYIDSVGGGTQYAVDAALGATPTGTLAVAIRDDALSALTPVEGDAIGLRVDANGALWVIPSGTLTVASHAVTNAGTFAVQVDGAALTALQLIDNIVQTEDTASANADSGVGLLAVRKATPANTSGTDGDYEFLQMSAGRLWASATIDAALPAGTNAIGKLAANSGVDIGDVDVTSVIAGTGATNLGKAEDAAHSSGDTGVFVLAVRDDTIGATSGTEGDYEALHTDSQGALWTNLAPNTAGGVSTFMASGSDGSSILVATSQAAKGSAGQVYGYYIYNPEAAVTFVHFYNTASASVTVGTTNPLFTIPVPAGSAANLWTNHGIPFSTAISVAATTTAGGNTAPTTGASLVLWYK